MPRQPNCRGVIRSLVAAGFVFAPGRGCGGHANRIILTLTVLLVTGLAACTSTTTRPPPSQPPSAGPAIAVSIGSSATCSVRVDGRVVCWGFDSDGDAVGSSPIGADFRSVSVGEGHGCAVKNNGDLACWISGRSELDLRQGPFIIVSAGRFHTCALREGGAAECWRSEGSAAQPSYVGQEDPPAGSGPFRSISAGDFHTCAVQDDGVALCWGANQFGQSNPPEGAFLSVSAGNRHTCGVQTDGSVACWGSNKTFPLNTKRNRGYPARPAPTPLPDQESAAMPGIWAATTQWAPPGGAFQSVSAGANHTCGIRHDGSIACWGAPLRGNWERRIGARQATPPAGHYRSVSAGIGHTCAVRQDGVIICWGFSGYRDTFPPGYIAMSSNGADYLCDQHAGGLCRNKNAPPDPDVPPDMPPPIHFTNIIAGALHSCGLTVHAAIACWGDTDTPPAGSFRSIAHGCAVAVDGTIACWRTDHIEQNVTPPSGEFSSISGGQTYHGRHHFCALAVDGSVRCWGYDFDNAIASPSGLFRQISVHGNNACGVRPDASLYCWHFSFGGLSQPAPQGRFQSVSVGEVHACAVRDNGRIACWGADLNGRASPPRGKFKSVSAGGSHSCGVRANDTLACWGANTLRTSPGSLLGINGHYYETHYGQANPPEGTFWSVAAGTWHSCGIQTDDRATCWGANNDARAYTQWNDDHYYGQATPPAGNP